MTDTDEVAILLAEDVKSGNANPDEKHCHFHAGVEYDLFQPLAYTELSI
jgi:zinc transporter 1/2/3